MWVLIQLLVVTRRSLFSNNCPPLLHTLSQINIRIAVFHRWFLFHPIVGTNTLRNSWPWHCSEGGPKPSCPSSVQPCKSDTYQWVIQFPFFSSIGCHQLVSSQRLIVNRSFVRSFVLLGVVVCLVLAVIVTCIVLGMTGIKASVLFWINIFLLFVCADAMTMLISYISPDLISAICISR